ncbi:ferredoxin reductase family protein [Marinomonas balearica]|uniref:Putative ferric reductase n=1 Tax=Marinomonas balearica TaxID=491947 RepID=A0A4R6MLL7_9GAMM|nr:ferredoxin reductase family protein [Marinomonas balearica]TDP01210.1 putative ferric reductase [Marinomonas balearica]
MRLPGLLLVVTLLLVPSYEFYTLAGQYPVMPLVSQFFGVAAIVAMGFVQLMATRLTGLEALFGGMDRIYIFHKWLGIGALALVLLHDNIDPDIRGLKGGNLADFGESLGGFSLDALQVLILVTVLTTIPYNLWKLSHKLMGVMFICGVLHFVFIPKPFELTSFVGLYTSVFGVVGIVSYFYCLGFRIFMRKHYRYQVESVERKGKSVAITLSPIDKAMKHYAGQFAFLKFNQADLSEVHPFTISKAPDSKGNLRFTVSALGDYTERLQAQVATGMQATITGAHGNFLMKRTKHPQVWVAAGVGITPFVAWANALGSEQEVHLFYSFKEESHAMHLDELRSIAREKPNFKLHCLESSQGERLSTALITQKLKGSWPKISVSFCGPKAMRQDLLSNLRKQGLSGRRFYYEEFEIRSGIGLMKLIRWGNRLFKSRFPVQTVRFNLLWKDVWNNTVRRVESWLKS